MKSSDDIAPRIQFAWWETLIMRAGFALLLWHEYPRLDALPPAGSELQFPTGLAHWVDLSWALTPTVYALMKGAALAACLVYVSGFAFPFASLLLLICYLVPATLQNSVGSISHYYQMMTLLLLAQTVASWVWCLRHGGRAALWRETTALHSFATRVTLQVLAGNYVLGAITKVIKSNGTWVWMTRFAPLQVEKTRWQTYYDHLQMPDMTLGSYLSELCLQHPWIPFFLYGPGLAIELFAFVVLFGRRWALAAGVVIVVMHELIAITMGLHFRQHEAMVLIYAVNVPYWAMRLCHPSRRRG